MSITRLIWVSVILLWPWGVRAQTPAQARLEADIRFLADDLLEGRGTPSRGLDIAALYLAGQLRSAGWAPALGDSYLQSYAVHEFSPGDAAYEISIGGRSLATEDFVFLPFGIDPGRTPKSHPLVFTGWGLTAPEQGRDDLRGAPLEGAANLVLHGAPWEPAGDTPFGYDRAVGKSIASVGAGASLLVYVTPDFDTIRTRQAAGEAAFAREMENVAYAYLPDLNGRPSMGLGPILLLPTRIFDSVFAPILEGSYTDWQERLKGGQTPQRTLGIELVLRIDVQARPSRASNVLAVLPGTDPASKDGWVVLTAHYDHLGSQPVPAGRDGVWNGADDNASGTAAVLEIARRLAALPQRARSALVFLTSGEDRGLLGSAHYSENPLVPFARVAVNINVDMVGRSDGGVQGIAPGSSALFERARQIGSLHQIQVVPDQQPSWRILYLVDSYHFARFEVPVIEFFTGLHPDYHQPSDEVDKIQFTELARLVDVIAELASGFVQGEPRPGFERPAWFTTP